MSKAISVWSDLSKYDNEPCFDENSNAPDRMKKFQAFFSVKFSCVFRKFWKCSKIKQKYVIALFQYKFTSINILPIWWFTETQPSHFLAYGMLKAKPPKIDKEYIYEFPNLPAKQRKKIRSLVKNIPKSVCISVQNISELHSTFVDGVFVQGYINQSGHGVDKRFSN